MEMDCSQASCSEEELKSSRALILTELIGEAFEFPASDWLVITTLKDIYTLFDDDTCSCLL